MSETQLANAEEARTETGEIKDQSQATTTETKPETPPTTGTEPSTEPKADGKTILTEKEPAKPGAPEKYEFAAPDGWKDKGWELDNTIIESATPIFKELGLSNEQAQRLVNFYAETSQKEYESSINSVVEQNQKWIDEVKADPEIGSKLPAVKATISRAIDGLGNAKLASEFREAMDLTGAGNNPAFIRALYKMSQALTEGTHVTAGGPSKHGQVRPGAMPESAAKAMYPTLP